MLTTLYVHDTKTLSMVAWHGTARKCSSINYIHTFAFSSPKGCLVGPGRAPESLEATPKVFPYSDIRTVWG